ncbi:hypothetical protein GCK32_020696, partial [Trichostrongylus colubriformis]
NKKMRKDYEEMEQSIYSQRIIRANHQANAAGHGPPEEVNNRLLKSSMQSSTISEEAAKQLAELKFKLQEAELLPIVSGVVLNVLGLITDHSNRRADEAV